MTGARYEASSDVSSRYRRTAVKRRRWRVRPFSAVLSAHEVQPAHLDRHPFAEPGRFIEETILSILGQAWPDLELIVIDGGSTDETLDIISKHAASIAFRISEPDRGQADAINKRPAQGNRRHRHLVRCRRRLRGWDLRRGRRSVAAQSNAIYAAPVRILRRGREQLVRPFGLSIENAVQYWKRQSLWHDPGLFWSRKVIDVVGELDSSLHYAFDFDYLVRALQHAPVEYVDHVAAASGCTRRRSRFAQTEAMMAETALVSRRYWA